MFFVLRDTCIVSHGIDFVTFFGLGSDEKRASQISDTARIVTKFVTKNYVFVTEYILWSTLGDDRIFVTRASQNAKHNENNYFYDINRTSPNVKSLVVLSFLERKTLLFLFLEPSWLTWFISSGCCERSLCSSWAHLDTSVVMSHCLSLPL